MLLLASPSTSAGVGYFLYYILKLSLRGSRKYIFNFEVCTQITTILQRYYMQGTGLWTEFFFKSSFFINFLVIFLQSSTIIF